MGFAPRGSQLDHWVDRPDVETWQHAKLTGTNKPMTCHTQSFTDCDASTVRFPRYGRNLIPTDISIEFRRS
jgi:hypothetical protein